MNAAHLHLILTHIPIFGCGVGLCLFVISLVGRSGELQRASLWMFTVTGLLTLPTYLTGRPANAFLMKLMPGMPPDPSDQHAEIAVIALTCALLLSLAAILTLYASRGNKPTPVWSKVVLLLLSVAATATMVWTANLGGKIRHSEIGRGVERAER
jgi:hypothetical protein